MSRFHPLDPHHPIKARHLYAEPRRFIRPAGRAVKVLSQRSFVRHYEHGETEVVTTVRFRVPTINIDNMGGLERLADALRGLVPAAGRHCHHRHDCCGCSYYTTPRVIGRKTGEVVVRWSISLYQ